MAPFFVAWGCLATPSNHGVGSRFNFQLGIAHSLAIKRREVIRVSEVTPELLWKMEFDVLYQFGR